MSFIREARRVSRESRGDEWRGVDEVYIEAVGENGSGNSEEWNDTAVGSCPI